LQKRGKRKNEIYFHINRSKGHREIQAILFIKSEEVVFQNNAIELYFEEDDIDTFASKLTAFKELEYVHPLFEHPWGQRVVRFYDPDKHIIEVGENMTMVVRKFIESSLSIQQTAIRMDVPVDYVRSCLTIDENGYER
jgi:hypothetical protein